MKNTEITKIRFIDDIVNKVGLIRVIKVDAWFNVVIGGGIFFAAFLNLGPIHDQIFSKYNALNVSSWVTYYVLYGGFFTGVISVFSGIGLIKLKEWGRKLRLVVLMYTILEIFIIMPLEPHTGIDGKLIVNSNFLSVHFIGAVFFLFILYFYTRKTVKKQFLH